MDQRQKLLIRNIIGGTVLLVLLLLILAWLGVFEGAKSDEAKIRGVMDQAKEEFNDRDWDDLLDLTNLSPADKKRWRNAVSKRAGLVQIDSIAPKELISVPEGATEYELDVTVIAHAAIRSIQIDNAKGTLYFVKKGDRWFIDWEKSAPTFPYVPHP